MSVGIEGFVRKIVGRHNWPTHERLQRQSCKHVQSEATVYNKHEDISGSQNVNFLQPSYVDHNIVRWKVVENVALGLWAKNQKPGNAHRQTHDQWDPSGIMRNPGKTIECRLLQGSIDEETIVIWLRVSACYIMGFETTYDKQKLWYISHYNMVNSG